MMATHRKKIVVSALVTLRGSLHKKSIGQIRENASIIFTNFVSRSRPRETHSLTASTGHDPFFHPSSGGFMEAVCTTFLARF